MRMVCLISSHCHVDSSERNILAYLPSASKMVVSFAEGLNVHIPEDESPSILRLTDLNGDIRFHLFTTFSGEQEFIAVLIG